jgi:hypothetical protein
MKKELLESITDKRGNQPSDNIQEYADITLPPHFQKSPFRKAIGPKTPREKPQKRLKVWRPVEGIGPVSPP